MKYIIIPGHIPNGDATLLDLEDEPAVIDTISKRVGNGVANGISHMANGKVASQMANGVANLAHGVAKIGNGHIKDARNVPVFTSLERGQRHTEVNYMDSHM